MPIFHRMTNHLNSEHSWTLPSQLSCILKKDTIFLQILVFCLSQKHIYIYSIPEFKRQEGSKKRKNLCYFPSKWETANNKEPLPSLLGQWQGKAGEEAFMLYINLRILCMVHFLSYLWAWQMQDTGWKEQWPISPLSPALGEEITVNGKRMSGHSPTPLGHTHHILWIDKRNTWQYKDKIHWSTSKNTSTSIWEIIMMRKYVLISCHENYLLAMKTVIPYNLWSLSLDSWKLSSISPS